MLSSLARRRLRIIRWSRFLSFCLLLSCSAASATGVHQLIVAGVRHRGVKYSLLMGDGLRHFVAEDRLSIVALPKRKVDSVTPQGPLALDDEPIIGDPSFLEVVFDVPDEWLDRHLVIVYKPANCSDWRAVEPLQLKRPLVLIAGPTPSLRSTIKSDVVLAPSAAGRYELTSGIVIDGYPEELGLDFLREVADALLSEKNSSVEDTEVSRAHALAMRDALNDELRMSEDAIQNLNAAVDSAKTSVGALEDAAKKIAASAGESAQVTDALAAVDALVNAKKAEQASAAARASAIQARVPKGRDTISKLSAFLERTGQSSAPTGAPRGQK